ncbi:MAG: ATP-binding protein, partial [Nanoarchaeota archaeon]
HRLHLSEFILVLMILLFLSVATKMMLQSHSSLLFTTVIVSLLGGGFLILLFRTGFLRPRIYSFYIIGIVGVLFLLTLSATSTYYVMQGMEPASMEYYASTEHRQLQSGLWRFDQEMDDIIAQVSMAAESVDLYAVNDSQLIAENLQTILYSYRGRFLASVHLLAEDQRVMGELAERNSDTGSSHYSLPVDRSADEPRIVRVRHMSSAEVVADLVIPSQSPEIPSLNAVIPLDWVVQVVFLRAMDPEASILLVAPDGEVVYRSREVSSEQADAVSKAVSTAEGSVFAYDLKVDNRSVEHVIMSVSGEVLDQDWTVISLRPKSTVHSFFSAYGRRVWRYTALFMVSIIILAVFLFLLLTNALRHEVQRKTGQVANANRELEKRIVQRTEELENKSAELERLNISLQQQIESKTYELRKKLASEERSTKAMIYILERVKSASAELEENKKQIENKNKELNRQSEKLMQTNAELLATQQDLVREKQSVELKVAERTRQLSEQKEKVSHLLALKTAFVNQLSHDLRTPLSPLNVLLPMMQDQTDDPAMKKRLDVCIRNTRFLTDLVTKTLDLAHLDAGRVEFDFCRFDIAKMIREAIRSRHQDRDQRIRIRTKMPARCMAYGDPLRIQEVLDNIVENGRKSMQEDGTITIGLEKKEGDVVVWVRDQGIGMTQEVLDRMFDEFYKEDNSRHDLRSFGLGLTISKRIIQAHKGRIWAVSQGVGHGATFFFSIPRTLEGKRKKDSR